MKLIQAAALAAITILCASAALAVETLRLDLREGETSDGAVGIYRDAFGNMVFEDEVTSPTTLLELSAEGVDHGTLAGLGDDDHAQYLNSTRHTSTHDASYNNALAISSDVNGNATLGAHVSDVVIHLEADAAETVTGLWNFANGVKAEGGLLRLGESQYTSDPAVAFEDTPDDAEILYDISDAMFDLNRPLRAATIYADTALRGDRGGFATASLSGFTSIEGIAAADLVSSTSDESISGTWVFTNGAEATTLQSEAIVLTGLPTVAIRARNGESTSIATGDPVIWSAVGMDFLYIAKLESAASSTTAFAGIALGSADEDEWVDIAVLGTALSTGSGTIAFGDKLTWNGSAWVTGTPAMAYALGAVSGSGSLRIMIRGGLDLE